MVLSKAFALDTSSKPRLSIKTVSESELDLAQSDEETLRKYLDGILIKPEQLGPPQKRASLLSESTLKLSEAGQLTVNQFLKEVLGQDARPSIDYHNVQIGVIESEPQKVFIYQD